ncbi:MAG: hypothetical protein KDB80_18540 [Planctomycetes bacterium]|nr:hypothetical protein [Planctomycetota bacterium]
MRWPRPIVAVLPLLVFAGIPACRSPEVAPPSAPSEPSTPDEHQIDWQRSLDDALAISRAEGRPLFVAVNMDGESASERIVRENYRDPKFVASTRHCVCLVASVFRHNARDYDDEGRRIPCPRLGGVTCGEHIALEPILYDALLHGDRVAPRHALFQPDGTKLWDHSLLFDLRDLDGMLARSAAEHTVGRGAAEAATTWSELAVVRDAVGRSRLESAFAAIDDPATLTRALEAVRDGGDSGAIGALRIAMLRLVELEQGHGELRVAREAFVAAAQTRELASALVAAIRDHLGATGGIPPELAHMEARTLLPLMASLDAASASTRSTVLAFGVTGSLPFGLHGLLGLEAVAAVQRAVDEHGGPVSVRDLLRVAESWSGEEALPRPSRITDDMPDADTLSQRLDELDAELSERGEDAELLAALAKASLDLARRQMESGQGQPQLLLEDAERSFAKALERQPARYEWWIESARTAYFLEKFEAQVRFGRRALQVAIETPNLPNEASLARGSTQAVQPVSDPRAIEALRWIGDGDARLLDSRVGADPAAEAVGMLDAIRSLGVVAASACGDANDWISLASLVDALGLGREAVALLSAGADRYPASGELRKALNDVLWRRGRIDLAPAVATPIANHHDDSADAAWFQGYAFLLAAENQRRAEAPDAAVADYASAVEAFERAAQLRADYRDNCDYYIALSWFGRGMAELIADRQTRAADCLVEAVRTTPRIATARDGLDREPIDLVDQCLEWRAGGSSPVDPLRMLDELESADPGNPFWAIAVSDAELREALRADGRNLERVERETVDAGGQPIRMEMGLPTVEGDDYLRASIAAGRRALAYGDTPDNHLPLAQSATIWAERMLQRLDRDPTSAQKTAWLDEARNGLAEAAPLLRYDAPEPDADAAMLAELAGLLRELLGPPRPRLRAGR